MSFASNCACPHDHLQPRAPLWDWQKDLLKWAIVSVPNGLTLAQTQDVVARALAKWSAVIPIDMVQAGPGEIADINITTGDVSYAGNNIWATGQMPNGGSPVTITVSSGMTWYYGSPELEWIFLHETGHTLGMIHSSLPDNVMFGTYNGNTELRQVEDINTIQAIYGVRPPMPGTWNQVASQGGSFTLSDPTLTRYGADSRWIEKTLQPGTYVCDVPLYGSDPAFGTLKTCQVMGGTPPTPTTPTVAIVTTGTVNITVNGQPVGG